MSKLTFSTKEAAEFVGMGEDYFKSYVRRGYVRKKRGCRDNNWQFTRKELERFAEDRVSVDEEAGAGADGGKVEGVNG